MVDAVTRLEGGGARCGVVGGLVASKMILEEGGEEEGRSVLEVGDDENIGGRLFWAEVKCGGGAKARVRGFFIALFGRYLVLPPVRSSGAGESSVAGRDGNVNRLSF